MNNPGFLCQVFIEDHNNIPKYQRKVCAKQCEKCLNKVLDYHLEKSKKK